MKYILTVLFVLLSICYAISQHQHPAESVKPAILMEGYGNHHHPIATSNPEAQKFFDQGLTLIYGFNHAEAIRSFQRAAELDRSRRNIPGNFMEIEPGSKLGGFSRSSPAIRCPFTKHDLR